MLRWEYFLLGAHHPFRPFKASDRPEGRVYLLGYPYTVLTSSGTSIWLILNPFSIDEALLRLSSPLYNAAWSELRGPIARELETALQGALTSPGLPALILDPHSIAGTLLAPRDSLQRGFVKAARSHHEGTGASTALGAVTSSGLPGSS